ncbi:hypothetical protein ES703_13116 [subsurface metagenome]
MPDHKDQSFYSDCMVGIYPYEGIKITGIISVCDAVSAGYPFLEAILSVMPIVDEFLIADGGSEDDTFKWMERLRDAFPKVKLYRIPWFKSDYWEALDNSLNRLIREASGDWIFESSGDNLWHEKDILEIKQTIEYAHRNGYNSIRHPCLNCGWTHIGSYVYRNVRIVRNMPGLTSRWGGDDFQLWDNRAPKAGQTAHNVQPELEIDIPFYHMHRMFPKNVLTAEEKLATFLAVKNTERLDAWNRSKGMDWNSVSLPAEREVLDCLPALIKGLSQDSEYRVRGELFDRNWLKEITGLDY